LRAGSRPVVPPLAGRLETRWRLTARREPVVPSEEPRRERRNPAGYWWEVGQQPVSPRGVVRPELRCLSVERAVCASAVVQQEPAMPPRRSPPAVPPGAIRVRPTPVTAGRRLDGGRTRDTRREERAPVVDRSG
jgi:hypothetical protein